MANGDPGPIQDVPRWLPPWVWTGLGGSVIGALTGLAEWWRRRRRERRASRDLDASAANGGAWRAIREELARTRSASERAADQVVTLGKGVDRLTGQVALLFERSEREEERARALEQRIERLERGQEKLQ